MATTYHQLGMTAQARGRLEEAGDWYRQSLTIEEELGNRPGMASSYHQLGMTAQDRGCCPAFKTPMKVAFGVPMWGCGKAPQPGWLRGFGGGGAGGCG